MINARSLGLSIALAASPAFAQNLPSAAEQHAVAQGEAALLMLDAAREALFGIAASSSQVAVSTKAATGRIIPPWCLQGTGSGYWAEVFIYNPAFPPLNSQTTWCGPYGTYGAAENVVTLAVATFAGTGSAPHYGGVIHLGP